MKHLIYIISLMTLSACCPNLKVKNLMAEKGERFCKCHNSTAEIVKFYADGPFGYISEVTCKNNKRQYIRPDDYIRDCSKDVK